MAVPVVAERKTYADTSGDVSTRTISLPTSNSASGDGLLMFVGCDGRSSMAMSGWSEITSVEDTTSNVTLQWFYKTAGVSESTSVELVTDANQRLSAHIFRVTGHAAFSGTPPAVSAGAEGVSVNPDPPSVTPANAPIDALFIASAVNDQRPSGAAKSGPDGWDNPVFVDSVGNGSATVMTAELSVVNASAQDPGTFDYDNTADEWVSQTLVIEAGSPGPVASPSEAGTMTVLGVGS